MKKNNLATSIILFILAIALLFVAILNNHKDNTANEVTTTTLATIQKQVSPYEAKDVMGKVVIIQNFKNSSVSNKPTNSFEKTLTMTGVVTDGYLYVKADVGGKALTQYDDIYTKLLETSPGSYQEYGGHLIKSQSLDTPTSETQTELLFDLSSIKYKKNFTDSEKEVLSGNWLSVLNDSSSKKVLGFSSTARQGNIQEMAIYYKCLENTNCSITVSP